MPDIVAHGSDQHRKDILGTQDLSRPARSDAQDGLAHFIRPSPGRAALRAFAEVGVWGDETEFHEERVGGLEDIDGVNIVVIGVWGVVDSPDGEEEAVDLV